jgi:hypothetical protein
MIVAFCHTNVFYNPSSNLSSVLIYLNSSSLLFNKILGGGDSPILFVGDAWDIFLRYPFIGPASTNYQPILDISP